MSKVESEPSPGRIVFTARDDGGNDYALVLYDDRTTAVLRNGLPFGDRCGPGTAERCVRLLLGLIGPAAETP